MERISAFLRPKTKRPYRTVPMPRHVRNSASDSQAALTDRPTLSPPSSTHYYYSLPANPTVVTLDGRHSPFAASTIQSKQHKSSFAKNIRPILAMLGAAAMTGAIVAIVFTTPYLTTSGEFSTGAHDGYIVTLTILSTIFAMSITSQIRALLLRQVDEKLNTLRTSGGPRLTESEEFRNLDGRWQTILSIEKFTEKFRHPRIALLYLTTGLITTSIVASFSLSTTTREYSFKSVLPLGPNRCILGWAPSMPAHEAYWWPIVTAGWGMDGGYFIQASLDDCPTREAVTLLGNINVESPSLYAYADKGVAVESSAIGTPVTIYSSEGSSDVFQEGLGALMNIHGSNLVSVTQCVPVIVKNPVSCHTGGSVLVEAPYTMTVFADNGLCNSTHDFAFDPLSATLIDSGVMGNVMCTHGSVGQGTIALGAAWHYAQYLSLTVGDTFWKPGNLNFNDSTYTVTCSLDTTDIFDYRTVTLNLQSSEQISQTGYTKSPVGGEPCIPDNTTVGIPQIATAAAANWQGLKEGQNLDGLFESILQVSVVNITALEPRTPPWAFNDSTNALEDVLGLTAALVLSRINSSTVAIENTYFVMATRIGSGKLYILAFTIPCALSAIALGSFLAFSRSHSDRKYRTSTMRDLMLFGRNVL